MKTTTYLVMIIILVISIGFFILKNSPSIISSNSASAGSGEVQKVVIGMKNYNYYPNTIKVKVNKPVSISLDNSVGGCFRSFTIREFGIAKYLASPEDKITFTPTKTGTFRFACSMGMGTGTIIVK